MTSQAAKDVCKASEDFAEGDRVSIRIWGKGTLKGIVRYVDIAIGCQRFKGLAVLGEDGLYYDLAGATKSRD